MKRSSSSGMRRSSRRRTLPQQYRCTVGSATTAGTNNTSSRQRVAGMPKISELQDTTMEDKWCDNTSITPLNGRQSQNQQMITSRMSPSPFTTTSPSAILPTFSDSLEIRRRPQRNCNEDNKNSNERNGDRDMGGGSEGCFDEEEDNISVLTDCSWMMDEDDEKDGEEDANSQIAAVSVASESLTVTTTATGSTTLPTNNYHHPGFDFHLQQLNPFSHKRPSRGVGTTTTTATPLVEPRKKRQLHLSAARDNGPFKRRKGL